ncbi:MAG: hypothetical protein ABSF03_20820 [Streptosporangiaceae bacterium]
MHRGTEKGPRQAVRAGYISELADALGEAGRDTYPSWPPRGEAGRQVHAFPLSVDGNEIAASLVLLAGHRGPARPAWSAFRRPG